MNAKKDSDKSFAATIPDVVKAFSISDESIMGVANLWEEEYVYANLPDKRYSAGIDNVMSYPEEVSKQLVNIIGIEQPITNTLLYKRILRIWTLIRGTSGLQKFINNLIIDLYKNSLPIASSVIYWERAKRSVNYIYYRINSKRDIQDIPILEAMNTARYAIEQQISIFTEDLKKIPKFLVSVKKERTYI